MMLRGFLISFPYAFKRFKRFLLPHLFNEFEDGYGG